MFNSDRKPLIRNSSERLTMRNWPLFVFLTGLIILFYGLYIYQAQNAALMTAQDGLNDEVLLVKKLRNELVDVKAELERLKLSENSLQMANYDAITNNRACNKSLNKMNEKVESLKLELLNATSQLNEKKDSLAKYSTLSTECEHNMTSLRQLNLAQEELVKQLNNSLQIQNAEIASLKLSAANAVVPVAGQAQQPAAAEQAQPNLGQVLAGAPQQDAGAQSENAAVQSGVAAGAPAGDSPVDVANQPAVAQSDVVEQPGAVAAKPEVLADPAKTNEEAGILRPAARNPVAENQAIDEDRAMEKLDNTNIGVDRPNGPGGRVKLEEQHAEEEEKAQGDRPLVQGGGDYNDKQGEVMDDDKEDMKDVDAPQPPEPEAK